MARHLKHCSQRSIWLRFRYIFKETTHEMATRFCFVDYDRTMAIVAEIETGGIGRSSAWLAWWPTPTTATQNMPILVADEWQGRGLGKLLTDYCLEICSTWGIDRVYAETTVDNQPMQKILRRQHFKQKKASDGEVAVRSAHERKASRTQQLRYGRPAAATSARLMR